MTRFSLLIGLGTLCAPMLGAAISQPRAGDVTGTWNVAAKFLVHGGPGDGRSTDMKAVFQFVQKGAALDGAFIPYAEDGKTAQPSLAIADGRVSGNKVTFSVTRDAETSLRFALVLVDGHLRGDGTPSKDVNGGGKLTIRIDATRRK